MNTVWTPLEHSNHTVWYTARTQCEHLWNTTITQLDTACTQCEHLWNTAIAQFDTLHEHSVNTSETQLAHSLIQHEHSVIQQSHSLIYSTYTGWTPHRSITSDQLEIQHVHYVNNTITGEPTDNEDSQLHHPWHTNPWHSPKRGTNNNNNTPV